MIVQNNKPTLIASLLAVLGLVASVAAFVVMQRGETVRVRENFHADVDAIVASFERELGLSFEALYALGNLFAREPKGETAFFEVAGRILERQQGIRTLLWWPGPIEGTSWPGTCYAAPKEHGATCTIEVLQQNRDWGQAYARAIEQKKIQTSAAFPLTLDRSDVKALKRFLAFLPSGRPNWMPPIGSSTAWHESTP